MKRSIVSVALVAALLVTMLSTVMIVPVYAANAATLTVSDVVGAKGDIVEVAVDVSADRKSVCRERV